MIELQLPLRRRFTKMINDKLGLVLALILVAQAVSAQVQPVFDIQGHRGARGLMPENTTAGFLRAVELGVTTIELDVVIAGDSTVVVSHEPWFSHTICTDEAGGTITDGQSHNIFLMSYTTVARYDCGSLGHPNFPRQERQYAVKPRLRDVIESVESYVKELGIERLYYNIEVKSRADWDGKFTPPPTTFVQLVYEVASASRIVDRVTLQSFDVRSLQAANNISATWKLAILVESATKLGSVLEQLGFTPQIFSPYYRGVDASIVSAAHARGMLIVPWTVNEVTEMQRLKALGVDGLITDYPDLAVALDDP